jgi:hypothetical protein
MPWASGDKLDAIMTVRGGTLGASFRFVRDGSFLCGLLRRVIVVQRHPDSLVTMSGRDELFRGADL